eukprot:42644_1
MVFLSDGFINGVSIGFINGISVTCLDCTVEYFDGDIVGFCDIVGYANDDIDGIFVACNVGFDGVSVRFINGVSIGFIKGISVTCLDCTVEYFDGDIVGFCDIV